MKYSNCLRLATGALRAAFKRVERVAAVATERASETKLGKSR